MLLKAQTIPGQICFVLSPLHFLQLMDMSVAGSKGENQGINCNMILRQLHQYKGKQKKKSKKGYSNFIMSKLENSKKGQDYWTYKLQMIRKSQDKMLYCNCIEQLAPHYYHCLKHVIAMSQLTWTFRICLSTIRKYENGKITHPDAFFVNKKYLGMCYFLIFIFFLAVNQTNSYSCVKQDKRIML